MNYERKHLNEAISNFHRALYRPGEWCISGRCPDTSWQGYDRLHHRDPTCPPFNADELEKSLDIVRKLLEDLDIQDFINGDPAVTSKITFFIREQLHMWADVIDSRGIGDRHTRFLVRLIDAYRESKGWDPDGYGGENKPRSTVPNGYND